jgi:hypothetical protein
VSTPRGARNTKRSESRAISAGPISRERLGSSVTALVIEQVLAAVGVHARLSDLVRGAQLFESAVTQSRSHRTPEQMC